MKLNRQGIQRLLKNGYTKVELLAAFNITRPTLDAYLKGKEPKSVTVAMFINTVVTRLLKSV